MILLLLTLEPITPRDAAWGALGIFAALLLMLCSNWRLRP